MNIAVIGGGAAGFFAAINVHKHFPEARVTIFEKSTKILSKVKVSGGGRCNVTNATSKISELISAYPRGGRSLKKVFRVFSTGDTRTWFESRGVPLISEPDGRVFPESQNSQTIINCFLDETRTRGIEIKKGFGVKAIHSTEQGLALDMGSWTDVFDQVIVATGGTPTRDGLVWLETLGHKIETPVPSLFTFNMPEENILQLPGLAVENVIVSIQGSKLKSDGPLLITHWGMSGPAILKLSAWGARELSEKNYTFKLHVNWIRESNQAEVLKSLEIIQDENPKKRLANFRPFALPDRLWRFLLERSGCSLLSTWQEVGQKTLNRLVNTLCNDVYSVQGKTTFKEEFVTCGGISLDSVDLRTMESKVCPNLYFAGEVLDIDGVTGGYNFQAAWTTAFIASKLSKEV